MRTPHPPTQIIRVVEGVLKMCEERTAAKFEVPVPSRNLRIGTEEGHDHVVRITGVAISVRTPRTRISLEIAVAALT
jgi:hypothetical protein